MTESYCVKCKKKTASKGAHTITTKNGRHAEVSTCAVCGTKKYRFVAGKKKTGSGRTGSGRPARSTGGDLQSMQTAQMAALARDLANAQAQKDYHTELQSQMAKLQSLRQGGSFR